MRERLSQGMPLDHPRVPPQVVFFSPSGVAAVMPSLLAAPNSLLDRLRIAAIGKTTAGAIKDASGGKAHVAAIAQIPDPVGLMTAITEAVR